MRNAKAHVWYLDSMVAKLFLILSAFLVMANSVLAAPIRPMDLVGTYEGVRESSVPQNADPLHRDRYRQNRLKKASLTISVVKEGFLLLAFFSGTSARDPYKGEGLSVVVSASKLSSLLEDCGKLRTFETDRGDLTLSLDDESCLLSFVEMDKNGFGGQPRFKDRMVQIRRVK